MKTRFVGSDQNPSIRGEKRGGQIVSFAAAKTTVEKEANFQKKFPRRSVTVRATRRSFGTYRRRYVTVSCALCTYGARHGTR